MKRDIDLIRQILLKIEADSNLHSQVNYKEFITEKYSEDLVKYNLKLMIDQGIVEGRVAGVFVGSMNFFISGLTWIGHDFLDASRDDARWTKAKSILNEVKDYSLDLAIKVLSELAIAAARKVMGL